MPQDRQKILDDVLDFSPLQVWGVDSDLRLTYLDGAAVAAVLQKSPGDFVGRPLRDILTDDTAWVVERHREALSGVEQTYEVTWRDTVFWVHLTPSGGRGPAQVHGLAVDITELHESRRRLAEFEAIREFAVRASGAGLWYLDLDPEAPDALDRSRLHLSPEVLGFIGFEAGEGPATVPEWHRRILERDRPLLETAARDHLEGRTPDYQVEYRIRHRDGSIRWIRSHGRLDRDEADRPVRWGGLDFDVTAERSVERRWDHLVMHLDTPLVYQNAHGVVTAANPAAALLLGRPQDELTGLSSVDFAALFVGADLEPLPVQDFPALVALRESRVISDVRLGRVGEGRETVQWLTATATPRLGPEGEPAEVFTRFTPAT